MVGVCYQRSSFSKRSLSSLACPTPLFITTYTARSLIGSLCIFQTFGTAALAVDSGATSARHGLDDLDLLASVVEGVHGAPFRGVFRVRQHTRAVGRSADASYPSSTASCTTRDRNAALPGRP